jgi:hypothetical protein
MGERDAGELLRHELADAVLVDGVDDRPQQAHRHRGDVQAPDLGQRLAQRVLVERHRDVALGVDALGHLKREALGDVGRRIAVPEVKRVELSALAQHQRVRPG